MNQETGDREEETGVAKTELITLNSHCRERACLPLPAGGNIVIDMFDLTGYFLAS